MAEQTVFSEMWNAYRGVIMRSIVTSFGLDFIVKDQHGGDVDTIRSIRETGQYKNPQNATDYETQGEYNSIPFHTDEAYTSTVRAARESHAFFDDAYVPGNRIYYGKASELRGTPDSGTNQKANLDHVISAKEIHEDRGRILAGLDEVEQANKDSNLKFTNERLNKSMREMSIEEYIQYRANRGDPLPDDVVAQMRERDSVARQEYERSIREAYYSSDKFIRDAGAARSTRSGNGFAASDRLCFYRNLVRL